MRAEIRVVISIDGNATAKKRQIVERISSDIQSLVADEPVHSEVAYTMEAGEHRESRTTVTSTSTQTTCSAEQSSESSVPRSLRDGLMFRAQSPLRRANICATCDGRESCLLRSRSHRFFVPA
jgi:hypothetical protein